MRYIKLLPILLLVIIPTLLIISWFKEGYILGTGESGLPFYDFNIQQNINKDAWAYYALGHPINIGSAAAPTYWFFAQLQNLGIPNYILQATFLWLIFIISGFSIYKLIKEFFPALGRFQVLCGVVFYWFNPFSMVNIWNRFLNNFFIFYALLPLSVYLLIKGLKNKKYLYALLIGLVSALFSYALTSMVFVILLWGTMFYLGIFHFLTHKQDRLFTLKFFLLAFFFWCLANLWWISQVFSYLELGSFNEVIKTSFKTDTNYNTFSLISERLGSLINIFRLKHATFFNSGEQLEWLKIYLFPPIILIEFLVASIFLIPLVVKKNNIYTLILGGLLLLSIFFTKGSSPPLGELFDNAFLKVPLLQLFRNPFEKIGFILSFSASILFAVGVFEIEKRLKYKLQVAIRIFLMLWIMIFWGFPFWSSYLFASTEASSSNSTVGYQVKVPKYYKEASNWLLSQQDNSRLTVLPLGAEGITYLWDKSYSGVELSNQILPKTSVSFNTNIPFYDEISKDLERLFLTRDSIDKILDVLNSKYVVLRSDIDWKSRRMRDPAAISSRIEKIASSSGLKKDKDFGDLSFWEYTNWKDKSIYVVTDLIKSKEVTPVEDVLNVESDKPLALYNSQLPEDELIKIEIIHPRFKFTLGNKNVESNIILRDDIVFPAVNILPSSKFYPLIKLKERLETEAISSPNDKIIKKISLLGKRLVEADKESTAGDFDGAVKALEGYEEQLKDLGHYNLGDNPNINNSAFVQEDLYKIFSRHSKDVDELISIFPQDRKQRIVKIQKTLKEFVLNMGIEPIFGYLEKKDYPLKSRVIYQFSIEKAGSYELLFNIRDWNNYFKSSLDEPFSFQINDVLELRKGELKKNGLVSFGFLNLAPGKQEIGWNSLEPINLIDAPQEFLMEANHGESTKSFPVKNLDPFSSYVLSLNYLTKKGSGVQVSLEGNNDPYVDGIRKPQFLKFLGPDHYDFELRNYTAYYSPAPTSDMVNLVFTTFPWNNCRDIFGVNEKRCKNEGFRRPYDRTSQILIKDVSLIKLMTETPLLKFEEKNLTSHQLPEVSFNKINNSEYKVSIKNATNKYALILSELFDPAWRLLSKEGESVADNHFLANGYANGWVVEKLGDYELIVKFTPQDLLKNGQTISLIISIFGLAVVCWLFKIKK